MYEVSDGRPRGPSSSPSSYGHPGRELPILFHLADVSRPRAKPVEKQLEKPMGEPAHILAAVERLRPDVETQAAVAVAPPVVAPASEMTAVPPAKVEAVTVPEIAPEVVAEPAATLPPVVVPEVIETKPAVEAPKAVEVAKVEVAEHSEVVDAEAVTSPEPSAAKKAAVVHPVHLRKKPKTSASEDWFASHGKYIAIVFVVALCGTVYFARNNREKAVAKAEPAPQSPLIETIAPAKSSGEQNLWPETMTQNRVTEQAAATPVQTASATESKVELLAPQTVAETPSDKKKDNLFEFAAAKGEERLAARTDDAAKSAAPALATPAEPTNYPVTPPPPSQYPVTNAPTAYPSTSTNSTSAYPSTSPSALPSNAPVAPPTMPSSYPAPAYQPAPQNGPSIDYRSQFPAAPAPPAQQQAWPPAGSGQQPSSYQPFDNTARGQRNERTGSGTY